ncbi:hypothetical protein DFJ74DRAFT_648748 [Hyaloraphidium curvatum]|nr:hypothetical protein DFJ74DRAFT_648748 [Hyaloraphidium curvatum]
MPVVQGPPAETVPAFMTHAVLTALQFPPPETDEARAYALLDDIPTYNFGPAERLLVTAAIWNDAHRGNIDNLSWHLDDPDLDPSFFYMLEDFCVKADSLEFLYYIKSRRPDIPERFTADKIGVALKWRSVRCLAILGAVAAASLMQDRDMRRLLRFRVGSFVADLHHFDADVVEAFCSSVIPLCLDDDDRIELLLAIAEWRVRDGVAEVLMACPSLELHRVYHLAFPSVAAEALRRWPDFMVVSRLELLRILFQDGPV